MKNTLYKLTVISFALSLVLSCINVRPVAPNYNDEISGLLHSGELAWQLSGTDDVVRLFGQPSEIKTEKDGGMELINYNYANNLVFRFSRAREGATGFSHAGLCFVKIGNNSYSRKKGELFVLKSVFDLDKLNGYEMLSNCDISQLDLRDFPMEKLLDLEFNSNTIWPPKNCLPPDFDPSQILEFGENPGLGIRKLHANGLDGRGVDIAIMDQPILRQHIEYSGNLKVLAEMDVDGCSPAMHGSLVSSIAVGKSCGVAPKATLYYIALPMWLQTNEYYIKGLEHILKSNRSGLTNIKVVSISTEFTSNLLYPELKAILDEVEKQGILVLTCNETPFNDEKYSLHNLGVLRPLRDGDRESPYDYALGAYTDGTEILLTPGDRRTHASETGEHTYVFDVVGGRSSAPPWLAGLAAIGLQVNPKLTPCEIRKHLLDTATKTQFGTVVNPAEFVKACSKHETSEQARSNN